MLMQSPEDYLQSICRIKAHAELRSLRVEDAEQSSRRRIGGRDQRMPQLRLEYFVCLSLAVEWFGVEGGAKR